MSIRDIDIAKKLRVEGARLGREGLSKRAHDLVKEYTTQYPDGHYGEAIMLAGKLHAIFQALDPNDYWREVAERGFDAERWALPNVGKAPR